MAKMGAAIIRQLETKDAPGGNQALRASSIGKCSRALSFAMAGTPNNGREIDGRARIIFAMGDMTEVLLSTALEESLAGTDWILLGSRETEQFAGTLKVKARDKIHEIMCHTDGLLMNSKTGESITLEIKSTSSYGFRRLESRIRDGLPPWDEQEGYWWQIQTYMHADYTHTDYTEATPGNSSRAYIIMMCKDSGALLGFYVDKDPGFLQRVSTHIERTNDTTPTESPRMLPGGSELGPRVDLHKTRGTPNKKHGTLAWQCCYCNWYRDCWPSVIETIEGNAKTLRLP